MTWQALKVGDGAREAVVANRHFLRLTAFALEAQAYRVISCLPNMSLVEGRRAERPILAMPLRPDADRALVEKANSRSRCEVQMIGRLVESVTEQLVSAVAADRGLSPEVVRTALDDAPLTPEEAAEKAAQRRREEEERRLQKYPRCKDLDNRAEREDCFDNNPVTKLYVESSFRGGR